MASKLRRPAVYRRKLLPQRPRRELGSNAPHLLYANLEFGKENTVKKAQPLLSLIGFHQWSERRVLKYLEKHQESFRSCLEWLCLGATTNLSELEEEPEDDPEDEFGSEKFEFDLRMREHWAKQPQMKFLQKHGLDHPGLILTPDYQEGAWFAGLKFVQRRQKDPLDYLCGQLILLLVWNGTVDTHRCAYKRCQRFFRARTVRKMYCSDLCRAKAHMDKKSKASKNEYMRQWRATKRRLRRARGMGWKNTGRFETRKSRRLKS